MHTVEYSDECGHRSIHDELKRVVDTITRMGDTNETIGLNGENITCNGVPEQWTDSGEGYEYVTICGQSPHPSGDPERVTLFTIVVTRPAPWTDHDEYGSMCPACGDPIDYCPGHGELGDAYNNSILAMHDNGNHDECHVNSECKGN